MNSDILRAAEAKGEKVSNNCYRPSVCSVLGEGEVVAEVAMVVAFQSSGLLKRGRSMHGQRYGGALRVEKEKTERGEEKKKYGSSIVSRARNTEYKRRKTTYPLLAAGHTRAGLDLAHSRMHRRIARMHMHRLRQRGCAGER
jgi:hypothetical protein